MNEKSGLKNVVKRSAILITVIIFSLLHQSVGVCNPGEETTAFVHVNVVPMTEERVIPDQTVVIKNGRIAAIGPSDEIDVPTKASIIDGRKAYLMPGLADMHMHLRKHWTSGAWPIDPFLLYLANGVTTIRCLGPSADEAEHALKWKEEILAGKRIGPTVYTCGSVLHGPVEHPARQVREQHKLGFDFIKLYSYMTNEEFTQIMDEAQKTGMYTVGHIPFQVGLDEVIAKGMNEIAHVEELIWELVNFDLNKPLIGKEWLTDIIRAASRDFQILLNGSTQDIEKAYWPRLKSIAARLKQADIPVCTTLNLDEVIIQKLLHPETFLKRTENIYLPRSYFNDFRNGRERHQRKFKGGEQISVCKYAIDALMLKALKQAGVDLLLSTDAGTGGMGLVPGLSMHDEIKTLIDNGFTPYEAIFAGTVTASKIIGRMTGRDDFGAIQPGKRADLLLLEADPLRDAANIKKLKGVMAAGKYYDQRTLQEMTAVNIPVEAAICNVHEPAGGIWTYMDIIIGEGFAGDPGRDIESITVEGPNGPLNINKGDFRYFSGLRDYWLKIRGAPQHGDYTFIVKGAGLEGRAFDSQILTTTIPLLDQTKMKPAADAVINAAGPTFSWHAIELDDSLYYQLEIIRATGDRVYRSPINHNMLSHTVPNDFLEAGERYRWRVRITDHDNFIKVQNRTQTTWVPLTMAKKLNYQYTPPAQADDGWTTSTLENEGVASEKILEMMQNLVDKTYKNVDSVIMVKNGKLVLEEYFNGYHRQKEHLLASTTKSITSILFGIAVDKKMISDLDRYIYEYFPEYKRTPWIDEKYSISLRHALTMTAGLDWDETTHPYTDPQNSLNPYYESEEPVATLLRTAMDDNPGSRWNYNSGLSILLGEVIRKASGLYPDKFAEKYLFSPLGINTYRWLSHQDGPVCTDGGLFMTSRDMAKFGQLMLDGGVWQGRWLISEQWVKESTRSFIDTGYGYGYGYQWRRGTMNVSGRSVEAFWASGMGGQKIYIFPKQDLVVVFTSKVYDNDLGHDLNDAMLVNHIIPAVLPPAAPRKPYTLSPRIAEEIIGDYKISSGVALPRKALDMIIKVHLKNDKLMVSTPIDVFEIIPESENRFYCYINGLGKIHFNIVTNKNGKVIRAIREIGFRRMSFDKIR